MMTPGEIELLKALAKPLSDPRHVCGPDCPGWQYPQLHQGKPKRK